MQEPVIIDGAHGEGGGQILLTALSLSAITGSPFRIERIRALRRDPGLAAQHLTAVRAAAALCGARLTGDTLGSSCLDFAPQASVAAGNYDFDVGLAREAGSAGAVTLVLQTVFLPLAFSGGDSTVELPRIWRGARPSITCAMYGCQCLHGSASRPPSNCRLGLVPVGKGEVRARIRGRRELLEPLDGETSPPPMS
jgi:RNA 3'-terminal phosphate cyclase (ATP)